MLNRRGFFGGLAATVASLFGLGKVTAGRPANKRLFQSLREMRPGTVSGDRLADVVLYGLTEFQLECLQTARRAIDGVWPDEARDPNWRETKITLIRRVADDLEIYGKSLVWVLPNLLGHPLELHRIVAAWWEQGGPSGKDYTVRYTDIPTCSTSYWISERNTVTLPHEAVLSIEISKEKWLDESSSLQQSWQALNSFRFEQMRSSINPDAMLGG